MCNRKTRRAQQFGSNLTSGFSPKREVNLAIAQSCVLMELAQSCIYIQHQLDATVEDAINKDTSDFEIHTYPVHAH